MKKISFVSLLMLCTSLLFSQPWLKKLPQNKSKGQLTLYDYKNAFTEYWAPFNVDKGYYFENGVKKKAAGWKQFKRWEYQMENQVNPTTGAFPTTTAEEQFNLKFKNKFQTKSSNGSWSVLGTNSSNGGYAGIGRIGCVSFHPTDINTYWVGTPAGGIWGTTDNGGSWTCFSNNNAVLGVSDIIIPSDYSTSNTIYIATGDRDAWDNNSVGVLKSTNSGLTWNTTGLSYTAASGNMVYRLLLDPNNNSTIVAAAYDGVYKTINGGTNWSKLSSGSFIDLEYKPGDFTTLYGSTTSGSIYVSTNGGTSWTQAYTNSSASRIELAVSPAQPTWVYALAADGNGGLFGIYKSTNSGTSYSQTLSGTSTNLLGWNSNGGDAGGQGWYDLSLAVSPSNASTLLVGGVNTWRSVNGGTSWSIVNHWNGSAVQAVHADKHCLKYRSNGDLFECNDGGIYISSNNGTSSTDKTNGLNISQMVKLGNSKTVSTEVITGLQDNGTKLLSGGYWYDVKGGDGMECIIDYSDVDVQYGTYCNGQITRTTDHWGYNITDIEPTEAGEGAWVTPYIIDPNVPNTLYAGYADVYKTTNRGDSWTKISTMATPDKIRSMAIAPSNTQTLYVADQSKIWKTTNGGTSWTDITGSLPTGYAAIKYITVKNDYGGTLWVTLGGYSAPGVYESTDGGSSWTNISAGLPTIPCNTIVQNKLNSSTVELYLGTDFGVYYKNGSSDWVLFNTGLPNVIIGELEIWYGSTSATSKLRAATYGRGLWESDLFSSTTPMSYVSSTVTQNNVSSVGPNQTNQEIIGIEIVTNGNLSPLNATQFTFNTTGTTTPAVDISNAKLYYTGGSNAFATSTQFGSVALTPNGTFNISGTQALSSGTNYFWLTYDVPATATLTNYLDAQCTSLTIGTAKTPTVINPSGNRKITVSYCTSGSTATQYETITNVTFGTINQTSSRGTNGYEDYFAVSSDLNLGATVPFSISVSSPDAADQLIIWIDFNRDGDFTESNETVYTSSGSGFASPHSGNFIIPTGVSTGVTRLRIREHYTSSGSNATPCGTSSYGEVEDYAVNLVTGACTPPTTQASAFTSSALTSTTMTTGWIRGNGTSVLVVARQGSAVNADPVNGTAYTANAAFGSGTQIGTGNYVVYSGTGSSLNLMNLTALTGYYFAVYEFTASTNCYKIPALTGNATTTAGGYCTAGSPDTQYETITNVTFGTINQTSSRGANGYEDYFAVSSDLALGATVPFSVTVSSPDAADQLIIWIDFNKDGDFTDANETVYTSSGSDFASPHPGNFIIPAGVSTGVTRLRIREHYTSSGSNATPCGTSSYGEVEDYSVNLLTAVACTPPTTQATAFTSSAITNTTMTTGWARGNGTSVLVVAHQGSAVNADPVNGTAYTAHAAFGSGTQIGTGNYVVYKGTGTSVNLTSLTALTGYYFAVYEFTASTKCFKTPALTGNATTTGGYCTAGSPDAQYEYFSNISFGTFSQSSSRGTNGYEDYSALSSNLLIGANVSFSVTVTNAYTADQIFIWIDYNSDGDFTDANETVYTSSGSSFTSPYTNSFTIPSGTGTGSTRLRVRLHYSASGGNTTPCGTSSYGEVEDYSINLINGPPPLSTPIITQNGNTLHSNVPSGNQWYDQDGIINCSCGSSVDQDYIVQSDGSYYVIVTDSGYCSDPSNIIDVVLTGMGQTENNKGISAYPNPMSDELTIEKKGNKSRVGFEIINSIGQVVSKGNLIEKTVVQTAGFPIGVYLIKLDNGKAIDLREIIKK